KPPFFTCAGTCSARRARSSSSSGNCKGCTEKEKGMKRVGWSTLAVALMLACLPKAAVAQSSGSFSASINSGACAINNTTGSLSGGITSLANVTVQTPNSSQTALLIRPSLVTGLFTDTQISKNSSSNITSSSAVAAVTVHVTLDGHPVAPD